MQPGRAQVGECVVVAGRIDGTGQRDTACKFRKAGRPELLQGVDRTHWQSSGRALRGMPVRGNAIVSLTARQTRGRRESNRGSAAAKRHSGNVIERHKQTHAAIELHARLVLNCANTHESQVASHS
jgi:hypothetical protein